MNKFIQCATLINKYLMRQQVFNDTQRNEQCKRLQPAAIKNYKFRTQQVGSHLKLLKLNNTKIASNPLLKRTCLREILVMKQYYVMISKHKIKLK